MGYGQSVELEQKKEQERHRLQMENCRMEEDRRRKEHEDNRRKEELERYRLEAEIRLKEKQEENSHAVELEKIKREAEKDKYQHDEKMKELEIEKNKFDKEKKMSFMEKLRSGDISIADLMTLLDENPNIFKEMGMGDVGDALARLIETLQTRAKTKSEGTPATQGMLVKKCDVDEKIQEFMAKLASENTSIADLPKMLDKNPYMFKEIGMDDGAVREALANVLRKLGL